MYKSEVLYKEYKTLKGWKSALTRYRNEMEWELNYIEEHEKTSKVKLYLGQNVYKCINECSREIARIKREQLNIKQIEKNEVNK